MDYNLRLKTFQNTLSSEKIEAFLVSDFHNILYLTGFKTLTSDEREAFVLVTKNSTYLFTDERYLSKNFHPPAGGSIRSLQLKLIGPEKGLIAHIQEIIEREDISRLGFEADDLKYFEFDKLKKSLLKTELLGTSQMLGYNREIKETEEIVYLKKACRAADECMEYITKIIKVGMSEKEIAFKMEFWIKGHGYDLAFDSIVAVDQASAVPHYNTKTGSGFVKNNSVILLDFGVCVNDYLSDISRMVFMEKVGDQTRRIYQSLLSAQTRGLKEASVIDNLNEIDKVCRGELENASLPSYPHSTGHGVGLEIHEFPKVSFYSQDLKKKNQVFTIEPGVYLPGKYGMRIEDTVWVTPDMKVESLTKYPKEICIIRSG